jgi:hypothetical protein
VKGTSSHSLLGASGAYRWLNCPGSFALSQQAPARPSSIYAATGTLAHSLIEQALREPASFFPVNLKGQTRHIDGHDVLIDDVLLEGVSAMLDYLVPRVRASGYVKAEQRVGLGYWFALAQLPPPPVPLFGQVDVALLDQDTHALEIVDYKNGAGILVEPENNPQLLYYAAGVLADLDEGKVKVNSVKLTVVQPNARSGEKIRSWETSALDVQMWIYDVLIPGVEACALPDAPLVSGAWCRFCPASHACPRLQADAVALAQREFGAFGDGTGLGELLDMAERAELWINAVRGYALEQLQRQVHIPGWQLVPTRPTRRWVDEETVVATVLGRLGLGDNAIWETSLRSPAQVEKVVKKQLSRDTWDQRLSQMVELRSSGVKLARADHDDARGDFLGC